MFVSSLGTVGFGLQLYASVTTSLVGYTDADWAGCSSHACLLQVIVFFWMIIFCLGKLNVSTPSLGPVPKLNTVLLLTLSQRLHD
ncbi:hypothetical protein Tco_0207589, partial [Tanacetum coccineum]